MKERAATCKVKVLAAAHSHYWLVMAAALPSVTLVGSYYALVIHMRIVLGGWPTSIGNQGFPPALNVHATLVPMFFMLLVALTIVAGLPAILVCSLVPRWRTFAAGLALHLVFMFVAFGIMQLAPSQFLYWWRD